MKHNTPLSSHPFSDPAGAAQSRIMTTRALREHGVTPAVANERCRSGGPWQMLLPGVYLLHAGPPTSEERLHAALRYTDRLLIPSQTGPAQAVDTAGGSPAGPPSAGTPAAGGRESDDAAVPHRAQDGSGPGEAMITGMAALALHGFSSAQPLRSIEQIDVLVPRTRRLRSVGCARIVRGRELPEPETVTGVPVAPVPRALADAVGQLPHAATARRLLTEAVRAGHCEAQSVVGELSSARLLGRPHLVDAVESLLVEGRARAEARLYDMAFRYELPDPCWNVDLRLPGAPPLGPVDAYWPVEAVALELDVRPHPQGDGGPWAEQARRRDALEQLGITVVHMAPAALRDAPERQAAIVRTALMAAEERAPAEYMVVEPR